MKKNPMIPGARKSMLAMLAELAYEQVRAFAGSDVLRGRRSVPAFATYNYQGGVLGGTATGPTYSEGRLTIAEIKLDFAAIAAARVAAGQAALAATDILQFVGVSAGIFVPWVGAQVSTVEGAAATVDIGDGVQDDGFIDTMDLNALGRTASLVTTVYSIAVGGGKFYNVDDTIDAVLNSNNVDVAVLSLFVGMHDLRATR